MRTSAKERHEITTRLQGLGVSYDDAQALRRISLTLNRWFEMECGTENAAGSSISIERDDNGEGKPFQRVQYMGPGNQWVERRYPVADREAGAKKRLARIMAKYPALTPYIQGDCRGASLYLLRKSDLRPGDKIDSVYNRGVAVY